MSWIQENKFVAGLIGVTAVVGGGILFFGNSQGNAFTEKMEKYESLKGQYASLEKSTPYPNAANRRAKEDAMAAYQNAIGEVRKQLNSYRPEQLEKLTPEDFSDRRVEVSKQLSKIFQDAGTTLPEETHFGFERYANSPVKSAATPKLNYQLEATKWLLTKLAEAKPNALLNVVRTPLPVETGAAATPAPAPRRGKGARANANRRPGAPVGAAGPYQLLPMELTFTSRENGVREFLKEMVNSEQYFFAIRSVRVRNEKQTAPTEKDANFPAPEAATPAAADPFAGFPGLGDNSAGGDAGADGATPGAGEGDTAASPSTPAPGSGERILKRVLGDEKLNVHIVFDVVLLKPVEDAADEAK